MRSCLGDVDVVLQADAKLAVDADHWLVREAHASFERCLVTFHDVSIFVNVESDAMARPMRQPWNSIARA
jgi:hypothetical protein